MDPNTRRAIPVSSAAFVLALAPLLLPGSVLQSQDAKDDGGQDPQETQEQAPSFYATATVEARPLSSATATVTVVGHDELEALNPREISEALYYVPGLLVTGNGSRGGLTAVQIRGGDPNFTLILLDGVPLNDPTDQLGGVFNLASLAAAGTERIEVVRGPLSSFYGSTGLSGAINIITRQGEQGPPRFGVELEGGDASLLRAFGSAAGPLAAGDYFVGLSWEEEEGRVAEDRFEQLNLLGNLGFSLPGGGELRLRTRLASWDGDDYPEASGGPALGSGELRTSENRELSLGLELRLPRTAGRGHKATTTLYRRELDRRSPGIFPLVPPSEEETDFTDLRLGWATSLERTRGSLSLGAELEREEGTNDSLLFLPPFLGGAVPGDYDIDRTSGGLFVEYVAERGSVVFEVGSRFDLPEGSSNQWSPRLGVGWRPGRGPLRVRGSLGRAFKLPSFFALATPPSLGGNPDLKPETAYGADAGIEYQTATGRLNLGLTLFYNEYRNLIDFDFVTFQLINRSEVVAQGVELSYLWRPHPTLVLDTNATWQEVEDQTTSQPLLHRPKWFGGARVRWEPREGLRLQLNSRLVSEALDLQIPVPERSSTGGYQLLGLAASWCFAHRWQVRGRLDNLTDKEYETLIGFPGPGRSVRVALRYEKD